MGKYQQIIKLFVVLFFSTAFIFTFSHFGAKAFENFTNSNGKFSSGTTICAVYVSWKTKAEAISLLEKEHVTWIKDTSIDLIYGEKATQIDLIQFHLDSEQTVDSIKEGQKNPAYIIIDKSLVEEQLQIQFPQLNAIDIDLEKLTTSLNEKAALFESGSYELNLYNDFLLADRIQKETILNEAALEMSEVPVGLRALIEQNPTIKIEEKATFSLLEFAKKQKIGDAVTLNILATGIYQAILPSNFSIVERNIASALPKYASIGFEAKVNETNKADLVFVNPNKAEYVIELQLDNNQLKITLKGEKFLYDYQISIKDEQKLTAKTIVQYSPLLLPGKTNVQNTGAEGQIVKIFRDVYQGNQLLKSELISEDYYPPVYRIEIHGLAGVTKGTSQTAITPGITQPISGGIQVTTPPTTTTPTTPGTTAQPNSEDSDLWGKPNEQPK
ncbi:MAG: VanW family protein [Bacillus sp. (in: Bacteria)]|nr:VanW family protein [Bacillus sp. (in: firmicutes)]